MNVLAMPTLSVVCLRRKPSGEEPGGYLGMAAIVQKYGKDIGGGQ